MTTRPTARVHRPAPGVLATSLDSAQSFPRHSHDTYGIGRIRRGAQRSWSAAGWVEAGPGDLLMVNPGEVHDGQPIGDAGRQWQMLYLAPGLVDDAASELGRVAPLWRPVARDALLAAAFERLHARLVAQRGGAGVRRGAGAVAGDRVSASRDGLADCFGPRRRLPGRGSGWMTIRPMIRGSRRWRRRRGSVTSSWCVRLRGSWT